MHCCPSCWARRQHCSWHWGTGCLHGSFAHCAACDVVAVPGTWRITVWEGRGWRSSRLYRSTYWSQHELCCFLFLSSSLDTTDSLTSTNLYLVPSGAPQNLTAMGKSATSVQLRWDLPARPHRQGEIALYEIMFSKRLEVTEDDTVNTTDKHVLIEGLDMNTDYIFKIRAYTSRGAGPWSNQLPFRTFGQCECNHGQCECNHGQCECNHGQCECNHGQCECNHHHTIRL